MAFTIHQWPAGLQRKQIEALPLAAQTAVLVMLREMRNSGPHPEGYSVQPLSRNLRGLTQANLKVRKEHIRVIYAVYGIQIVLVSVFKKTSLQLEKNQYKNALARKRTIESIITGGENVPTIVS
jgi:hypothetical protein